MGVGVTSGEGCAVTVTVTVGVGIGFGSNESRGSIFGGVTTTATMSSVARLTNGFTTAIRVSAPGVCTT